MPRSTKLDLAAVDAFVGTHPGWERADEAVLVRGFSFPDFASALAFAVRVGCLAERRDHHPELHVAWGRVTVSWSTHDAGGVTSLDLDAAVETDALAR